MVRRYRFDVVSSAQRAASVACVALLSLACSSDAGDADDESSTQQAQPAMANTPAPTTASTPGAPAASTPAASEAARPSTQSSPPAPAPSMSGAMEMSSSASSPSTGSPAAVAPAFAACIHSEGSYGRNCDSIYVTMKQMSPARCVQLTIDNCGEYGREGLPVSIPMPWRLDSGTVGSSLSQCELGVFYPSSTVAQRASGEITWNDAERLPTEIELDVTLVTTSSATEATNIEVTTAQPIIPVDCDE
jgi:hypothetical protein